MSRKVAKCGLRANLLDDALQNLMVTQLSRSSDSAATSALSSADSRPGLKSGPERRTIEKLEQGERQRRQRNRIFQFEL